MRRRESYAKTAHQHGSGAEHGTDRNAAARPCPEPLAPPDTAKAARWAVEAGLLPDMGEGAFTPGKRVTKVQVIRAWNRLKKLGLAK